MTQCTNPSRPCHLHDERNEWIIEVGRTTRDGRWYLVAGIVAIALSVLFN